MDHIILPGAELLWHHTHSAQFVRPTGAAPVTLTSGVGAWALGNFSADIIAAGDVTSPFDIHWVVIANMSANAWYEIVLYWGAADTEFGRLAFARTNATLQSISHPMITEGLIPASSRVRAKMMDGTGALTCDIKVEGHRY